MANYRISGEYSTDDTTTPRRASDVAHRDAVTAVSPRTGDRREAFTPEQVGHPQTLPPRHRQPGGGPLGPRGS